ncbi:hypothetical protein HQ489_01940 [Candidatus Woesearchaeota archaeon]|nr:hypothetical protein [Candidatus Woesearchaeota archaeon]
MVYRIITHGNCPDGFASAFFFKKYWKFLAPSLTQKDVDTAEIIGLQPRDVQSDEFKFTEKDIILDLPKPKTKVFFWCDHHSSNKEDNLPENHHWHIAPGNAGLLIDIAVKNGLTLTDELASFKRNTDIMDAAEYSSAQITECFYEKNNYEQPSDLLKLHMIAAMFHTRDNILNDEIFRTILMQELADTPISSQELWQLNPAMFHKARMKSYQEWREVVDEYMDYDEDAKCVVQDDRLAELSRGVADRFYGIMKYPECSYTFSLRERKGGETTRIGIGSNIFHKDRCIVDIGKLCKVTADKYGDGSGGGHAYVGGCTIDTKNANKAKEFILNSLH